MSMNGRGHGTGGGGGKVGEGRGLDGDVDGVSLDETCPLVTMETGGSCQCSKLLMVEGKSLTTCNCVLGTHSTPVTHKNTSTTIINLINPESEK